MRTQWRFLVLLVSAVVLWTAALAESWPSANCEYLADEKLPADQNAPQG